MKKSNLISLIILSITVISLAVLSIVSASASFLAKWSVPGPGAPSHGLQGMAIDGVNNIYVADGSINWRKFNNSGTLLFSGDSFQYVYGLAIDVGRGLIYTSSALGNNDIQKFRVSDGALLGRFGQGSVNQPRGIATDSSGNLYVVETGANRVRKFAPSPTFHQSFVLPAVLAQWGSQGSGDGQFNTPWGIAVDASGNVYVADHSNHRVQKFSSSGVFVAKWGGFGTADGQFNGPTNVAVDSAGRVYVSDSGNNRVQVFSGSGSFVAKFGTSGSSDGQFSSPRGIVIDSAGNIYVADNGNNRVQKFSSIPIPDNAPPVTTATANNADGSSYSFGELTNQVVNIILSCADGGSTPSGCKNTKFCTTANSSCTPATLYSGTPYSISEDGTTNTCFSSEDNAGNVETAFCGQVVIDTTPPDTTPPAVTITSPLNDEIKPVSASVTFSASDASSPLSYEVSLNGALVASGNTAPNASVTVSLSQTQASNNVSVSVTDPAGNIGSASVVMHPDDTDGIEWKVDRNKLSGADESITFSSEFNDGEGTYGTVTDRGGWTVNVTDLPSPAGVRVSLSGSGSTAKIISCNNNVETQLDSAGEIADITCGSTTVTAVQASPNIKLREPQSGTGGKATTVNLMTGQTATLGSFVAASPSNTSPISVEVVDQNDNVLGEGLLNPGQILDIEPNGPNDTVVLKNLGSEPVSFTLEGAVLNLIPGEQFSDLCPNSVTDSEPNENRFSWVGGAMFKTKDPKTKALVDSQYSMAQTKGCTCGQILEKTSGQERGQEKAGCTKETLDKFVSKNNLLVGLLVGVNGNLPYIIVLIVAVLGALGFYYRKRS
jgi:DNA-binding beta-propeller fold protein YncE